MGVRRVLLFGSRARGDQKAYSDIDLAIDWPDMPDGERGRVYDIIDDAKTLLKIDYVYLDSIDDSLLVQINEDAKEIV